MSLRWQRRKSDQLNINHSGLGEVFILIPGFLSVYRSDSRVQGESVRALSQVTSCCSVVIQHHRAAVKLLNIKVIKKNNYSISFHKLVLLFEFLSKLLHTVN